MAYTDATAIAAYLGVTLTSPQQTQAGVVADAATAWIERYTGKSWQIASPVTDELHQLVGDRVYLNRRPVTAVSAVKTRQDYAGSDPTTLDSGSYELLDADNGVLLILGWARDGVLALVTYTHSMSEPPDDVALAATMIAASWLAPTLAPQTNGLDQISVGQNDVVVRFKKDRGDVPAEARTLLRPYRTVVIA